MCDYLRLPAMMCDGRISAGAAFRDRDGGGPFRGGHDDRPPGRPAADHGPPPAGAASARPRSVVPGFVSGPKHYLSVGPRETMDAVLGLLTLRVLQHYLGAGPRETPTSIAHATPNSGLQHYLGAGPRETAQRRQAHEDFTALQHYLGAGPRETARADLVAAVPYRASTLPRRRAEGDAQGRPAA